MAASLPGFLSEFSVSGVSSAIGLIRSNYEMMCATNTIAAQTGSELTYRAGADTKVSDGTAPP
jgi:hypothetical protein